MERILIPPYGGSNPPTPASQCGLCGVISRCGRTADIPEWETFCKVVKHESRFFFTKRPRNPDPEILAPGDLLEVIARYAVATELVRTMPAGQIFYRARRQRSGERFSRPPTNASITEIRRFASISFHSWSVSQKLRRLRIGASNNWSNLPAIISTT